MPRLPQGLSVVYHLKSLQLFEILNKTLVTPYKGSTTDNPDATDENYLRQVEIGERDLNDWLDSLPQQLRDPSVERSTELSRRQANILRARYVS